MTGFANVFIFYAGIICQRAGIAAAIAGLVLYGLGRWLSAHP